MIHRATSVEDSEVVWCSCLEGLTTSQNLSFRLTPHGFSSTKATNWCRKSRQIPKWFFVGDENFREQFLEQAKATNPKPTSELNIQYLTFQCTWLVNSNPYTNVFFHMYFTIQTAVMDVTPPPQSQAFKNPEIGQLVTLLRPTQHLKMFWKNQRKKAADFTVDIRGPSILCALKGCMSRVSIHHPSGLNWHQVT